MSEQSFEPGIVCKYEVEVGIRREVRSPSINLQLLHPLDALSLRVNLLFDDFFLSPIMLWIGKLVLGTVDVVVGNGCLSVWVIAYELLHC